MKQKDIILIMVMVFIGAVLAFVVSNFFFSSKANRQQTGEIVDPISANFPAPPSKYFNPSAVNPAQPVQIGDSNNQNPFNTKSQ